MEVAYTVDEVKQRVRAWRREGLSIGLVPTMGYLHEGHKSLMDRARRECDRVVASVFVNPTQFGPTEDLDAYPRDFEADCKLMESAGVDLAFHPEPSEMYLPGSCTFVDMTAVKNELCGKTRPVHFSGVCTVVSKLMNISECTRAYFGQKDAQQLAVITRMVRDLNMNVEVIGCPIVREDDGLAKSSRNVYLSADERAAATVLSCAVARGRELVEGGERDGDAVLSEMRSIIEAEPLADIEYVEMVSWPDIEIHHEVDGPVLVAMAVRFGTTRLIDNFIYEG